MARSTYYFEINKIDPVAIRNEELLLVIKKNIRRKQRQIWGTQSLYGIKKSWLQRKS